MQKQFGPLHHGGGFPQQVRCRQVQGIAAGSHSKGAIHPLALNELVRSGLPTGLHRSIGTFLRPPTRRKWISVSPSVTALLARLVPGGPGRPFTPQGIEDAVTSKARTLKKRRHCQFDLVVEWMLEKL
jgi:hypothetical protein